MESKRGVFPGIRTRSSPQQFFRCIQVLFFEQRINVKEMCFGQLLNSRVGGLPEKLTHYMVDNFDPSAMEMKMRCSAIEVTSKAIHKLLGIP
ncbi:hypothetical protein Hdeb2414_s0006g00206541 [Helianthus debilis subsp. tardiflorus]